MEISAGLLRLTLSDAAGLENVIGTAYADDITGYGGDGTDSDPSSDVETWDTDGANGPI